MSQTQIFQTSDYDQFKFLEYNRVAKEPHIKRLCASILNHNDLPMWPICVTSKMEVVDGQHRLLAAKRLQVPIYYVIDDDYSPIKMVTRNTTQMKWTGDDYLNYYSHQGYTDYVKLAELKKDVSWPLQCLLTWVPETDRAMGNFKEGRFKFKLDAKTAEAMKHAARLIEVIAEYNIKPSNMWAQKFFHQAMKTFFMSGLVDAETFFAKFGFSSHQLRGARSSGEYIEMFVSIYNNRSQTGRLKVTKDGRNYDVTL